MKYFQKIGKSLMVPVACMPICGILIGIGYLLCPASIQGGEITGFMAKTGYFLCTAGGAVIDHIPILFAISVGIGMSDGECNGGIAALVSWLIITTILSCDTISAILPAMAEKEIVMLSLSRIENTFIGIIAGLIGAFCIGRFKNTCLPPWLSFFSGRRLGIIITGLVSIAVSAIFIAVWPLMFSALVSFGKKIAGMGYLGSAIYVTLNRLLIPFGMHHALNSVFWFDTVGIGDLTAFWAGKTSAQVGWSVGMYMSGFFPSMMFGVPAAALAMYRSFKNEDRNAAGILLSAAIASLLCGVTEPFEFLFMFISPVLYGIYAVLYGVFTYIVDICGFRAGFSFSGGLIDLIFSASLPAAQRTLLIIPIGIAAFAVYYSVFRLMIVKLDLKTPGREKSEKNDDKYMPSCNVASQADEIIRGLGGKDNILSVSNCTTRLRIELKDNALCNDSLIKKAGAAGVIKMGNASVQVIIGLNVEFVADEIKHKLSQNGSGRAETVEIQKENVIFKVNGIPEMIHGRTGNSGIAVGKVFLKDAAPHPERKEVSSTDDEMMRFEKVLENVRTELLTSVSAADSKAADILEVQLMMLEDESLIESIKEKISGGMNAEYAVYESGNERTQTFEQMDDAYLCARASDMRDIADKIFFALIGHTDCDAPEYPCIYVAEDLTPEQIVKLDKSNILGIVTRKGSANSHTAILAGNYGIPYLFSVDFDREKIAGTEYAALDAVNGLFILSPDEETQRQLFSMKQDEEKSVLAADDYSGKVKVLANIAKPEDMDAVIAEGADGVGLYRTEFLYMNRNTLPDEEEQFIAYKTVLERMHGKDVTIRTMDIGADKKTGCIKQQDEENPALGKRAIRICLMDTELFRTQLRALLRAAVYGNEYIMYPMISSENEIDAIMEQVNIAASELDERHERYRIPPQGIMIETPAAAMISDILAEKVDFFSIGTNDLTQYTTALDRQAEGLERFYYPNHEAVFRLMELTVENAHKKGISVSICGEMGSDPQIIPRLYEMGIDELSMSPKKVRKAKSVLASMQQKEISSDDRTESIQMADGICAPVDGILVPMEEIRDEAFASGVLGKCIGIIPENGKIYAPCNGTVTMIAESFHAIGIHSDKGQDVLLHIGIDTVTLGGKGFHCNVRTGDTVTKGSLIMTADLELIKKAGLDTTVIIAVC